MCPLYVAGLIGPGERKSMQPIAERLDPARYDRFHHFISDGLWDEAPIEAELARTADQKPSDVAVAALTDAEQRRLHKADRRGDDQLAAARLGVAGGERTLTQEIELVLVEAAP